MPIIECVSPWLQLKPFKLPPVPLLEPEPGCQAYFVVHHVNQVIIDKVTPTKANCTGTFCDRQRSYRTTIDNSTLTGVCGCYSVGPRNQGSALTLNMRVVFPLNAQQKHVVHNFSSWRTSMLAFKQQPPTTIDYTKLETFVVLPEIRN